MTQIFQVQNPDIAKLTQAPGVSQPFSPEHFLNVATDAVRLMLDEVRTRFWLPETATRVKSKDATLVGDCDGSSGRLGRKHLQSRISNALFSVEDVGLSQPIQDDFPVLILVDPLDGTRPWTNGVPTSSVIVAAYDLANQRICACVIGELALGRIWRSIDGHSEILLPNGQVEVCQVWQGELSTQSTVFLDAARDFKGTDSRVILENSEVSTLHDLLFKKTQVLMLGSNGLHQALVASGGNSGRERVAGGITTAKGGPWDVAGAHLIDEEQAGGALRAFDLSKPGHLIECDPLNPLMYDVLVYGNSRPTVDSLSAMLASATRRHLKDPISVMS